ncbi:Uncharacterised protein [uncultured archaeon]|nr:Uncharacterised protein [uncultured archaeon]
MLIKTNGNRKIHFLFSFGLHAESKDSLSAKKAADAFRPHIYATEEPELTRKERYERANETNGVFQKARQDLSVRKKLLDHIAAGTGNSKSEYRDFHREQMAYLIDSPLRPVIYPLEAHDSDFSTPALQRQKQLVDQAAMSASMGKLDAAIKLEIEAHATAGECYRKREEDIITNMKTYLQEALEKFPQLARFSPLRVFSRLGHAHSLLYPKAMQEFGGRGDIILSRVFDRPLTPFSPEEQIQRAASLGMPVSPEAALRALTYEIINTNYTLKNGGTEYSAKRQHCITVATALRPEQLEEVFTRNISGTYSQQWVLRVAADAEKLASASP